VPERAELERQAESRARRAPVSPAGPDVATPTVAVRPGAPSRAFGPAAVLAMQRHAGNRAVVARLRRNDEDAQSTVAASDGAGGAAMGELAGDTMAGTGVAAMVEAAAGGDEEGGGAGSAVGGEVAAGHARPGGSVMHGEQAGGGAASGMAGSSQLSAAAGSGMAGGASAQAGERAVSTSDGSAGGAAQGQAMAGGAAQHLETAAGAAASGAGSGAATEHGGAQGGESGAAAAGSGATTEPGGAAQGGETAAGSAASGAQSGAATEHVGAEGAEAAAAAAVGGEAPSAAGAETAGHPAGGSRLGGAGSHAEARTGGGAGAGAGSAGAAHAGPGEEAAGSGGMGGGGGPASSEEVEELPEPGPISMAPVAALGQPPEMSTEAPIDEPGEIAAPEAPALEGHVSGIEGAVGSGGGGVLDEIMDRALGFFRPITSRISSGLRSAASGVVTRIGNIATSAWTAARGLMTSVVNGFRSLAGGILGEIRSHLGDLQAGVRGIVGQVFGAVRGVMGRIGGAIRGAVSGILSGQPVMATLLAPFRAIFDGMFGDITGRIRAIVERVRGVVNGAIDRLVTGAAALAQQAQAGITALGASIASGLDWLQQESERLLGWINELVGELPGLLRDAISGIVNRVLGFIRRILASVFNAARGFINAAVSAVNGLIGMASGLVTRAVNGLRNIVTSAVTAVENGVQAIGGVMSRVGHWLYQKAAAGLSRVLKAVFNPIAERLQQRVLAMIGPAVGQAIEQAKLMFPNGLPAPEEIAGKVATAARDEASADASAIIAGLTNPEGDHLAYGVTLGGSVGGGVGVGGAVGATLDVVLDYRRNDVGFFISPQAGGQVNIGDVSGTGNVSAVGGWGTVGNFGDPSQDVLGAYGGFFTNATYGAQAGLAVEGGVGVSTGGSFYRGGATTGIPIASFTPLGADSHPVPGTGTAGTTTPGTPDRPGTLALGEVRFPRQVAEAAAAPGGQAAIDHAADLALAYPGGHPGGQVTGVDVLGGASRVFERPGAGRTREEANRTLAERRAQGTAELLRVKLPGVTVAAHGNGDAAAAAAGKPVTDASAEDQRASMVASTMEQGTAPTSTPGTPPTQAPNQHTFSALQLPNPFQAKQAWGWDTTVGVTGYAGAGAKAGVYGGAGVSYSIPLGKTHFDADTMRAIRLNVGFLKLVADIASMSPLGFIRDALGLAAMSSQARAVETEIINAIGRWVIELPPGAAVA